MSEGKLKKEVKVQSLLGKANLNFYLKCLKSLLLKCKDNIHLHLHQDGSLEQKDEDLILNEIPGCTISTSTESKERTLDHLKKLPFCQQIRQNSIWGIEFFDPLFAFPNDRLSFYIDADIFFIRPFEGLFDHSVVNGRCVFLRDTQWNAYSLTPKHLLHPRISIVKGITTAVVCWDKSLIDWDYLEWFLDQKHLHKKTEWVLPTAQSILASKCLNKARTVHAKQILNLYPNAKPDEQTFGMHLFASYRKKWLQEVDRLAKLSCTEITPVKTKFESCKPCGITDYMLNHGKRWINTRLNYW